MVDSHNEVIVTLNGRFYKYAAVQLLINEIKNIHLLITRVLPDLGRKTIKKSPARKPGI